MENKTPIEMLAALLAEMTTRAAEAERELAEVKKSEDTWYQSYLSIKQENATLKAAVEDMRAQREAVISEMTEEIETLRKDLAEAEEVSWDLRDNLKAEMAAHEETKANLEKATQHLAYYIEGGAENDSE